MNYVVEKMTKNMRRKNTIRMIHKFFSMLIIFTTVTSWMYGIVPGLENYSPKVKTAEAANAWSMRQEINILDEYLGAPTAAYATSSAIINLDTTEYSGTVSYYLEVVASSSSALFTNFYLRNLAGQTIATLNPSLTTSYNLYRSASFTPTAGANDYVLVVGNESGATKGVKAARIVILQSFAGTANSAATSTETHIEIGNSETYASAQATTTFASPKYWYYDSTKWDGTTTFYAEVTYKTIAGVASSTAYNTAGTYTVVLPVGTASTTIELTGGGGAGGGASSNNSGGDGGAGGQYAKSTISGIGGVGSSHTLVVGATTAGTSGAAGSNGKDSTWDSTTVVAKGGTGGQIATASTTGSTTGCVGDTCYAGGSGGKGVTTYGAGGGGGAGTTGTGASATGAGVAGTATALAGGAGGAKITSSAAGGSGATAGGGGGGGFKTSGGSRAGGTGAQGKATTTNYIATTTIVVQESDGTGDGFVGWTDKAYIVTGGGVATSTRVRSSAFTPTSGRNYRIAFRNGDSRTRFAIYNAKIIVDQVSASEFTKLEPQYLQANTLLASGTNLQSNLAKWDSTEWSGVANVYVHQVDSANGSASVVTINTSGGTLVTGSTVTSPDNRGVSTAMTMPVSGNLDMKATTNNNDIYSSRILVQVKPTVTFSGKAYQSESLTPLANGTTITVYKNGSTLVGSTVTSGGDGSWSISDGIVSGDIVTVYIDNDATYRGNTVLVSDGVTKSDINVYGGELLVRQDTGSGITNANLQTGAVYGESDMVYATSTSNAITLNSNFELHVWAGDTYTPGGSITTQGTGNLHMDDSSTATLNNGGTYTIAGDIVADTGSTLNINDNTSVSGGDIITAGTATVTTTSGTPTLTLSGSGSIGGGSNPLTFYNLTISSTAVITGSTSFTINHTLNVNSSGSLILSGGTVTLATTGWGITNSGTLTFNGLTISETPSAQPSSSFSIGGTLTVNASKTLAPTAGTITMTGGSITNNNSLTFYNLTLAGTVTTSSTIGVAGALTSSSGTLTTSGGTITVTGDLSVAGTISGTGNITVNGGDVTGNGTLNLTSGTFMLDGTGLFGGNTNWTFNNLTFGDGTGVATTTSTGSGSVTSATTTVALNQKLDAGVAKTWNITASHEPLQLQGFLLASTSTFSYQSVNNATVTPATYYNLDFSPPSGNPTYKLGTTTGQTITVGNNFTVNGSGNVTVDANTRDPIFNVSGNMTIGSGDTFQVSDISTSTITGDLSVSGTVSGGGNVVVNGGDAIGSGTVNLTTGTFTLKGTGNFGGNTGWTFYNLTFGDGTSGTILGIGSGNIAVTNVFTVATNQLFNAGAKTYSLTGVGSPLTLNGTFGVGTSTIAYNATAGGQTFASTTYYNLSVSPISGTNTFTFPAGGAVVNNNFTISNTASSTITAATNNAPFVVGGTFAIGEGTTFVSAATSALNLFGDFTNNGTFTANGGTVTFSTTSASVISSLSDMSFYNMRATVPGATLKFKKHTTNIPTFTIAGTMTVTGSESTPVYIESDTPGSEWLVNFSLSQNAITYASIRDSECAVGSASATSSGNLDRGNNDSCWGLMVVVMYSGSSTSIETGSGGGTLQTGGDSDSGNIGSIERDSGGGTLAGGGTMGGGGGESASP